MWAVAKSYGALGRSTSFKRKTSKITYWLSGRAIGFGPVERWFESIICEVLNEYN